MIVGNLWSKKSQYGKFLSGTIKPKNLNALEPNKYGDVTITVSANNHKRNEKDPDYVVVAKILPERGTSTSNYSKMDDEEFDL